MNTNNPTELRIGMSGPLFDRTYTIRGRVVLSTDIGGERYYWHEFFLKADSGEEATLVFEETDGGPTWKYFEYLEPQKPLSVIDASRITEGDRIKIDDFSGVVDFVGSSTVRAIDGEAPEGIERDDYSQFFNASGKNTLVVSWANGEVEHYIGQTITRKIVRDAFGHELPAKTKSSSRREQIASAAGSDSSPTSWLNYAIIAVVAIIFLAQLLPSCSSESKFQNRLPPTTQLDPAKTISLQNRPQRIVSTAIIEYATSSFTRQGRLYELVDDNGIHSQLLQGIENDPQKWTLLDGLTNSAVTERTPKQFGALKYQASFDLNGQRHRIIELFRLRVTRCEAGTPDAFYLGKIRYGFISENEKGRTLFDWDEQSIHSNQPVILSNLLSQLPNY